ncbi:hypothetical protein GGD83_000052 [Rhodoblastus sphagnicola]|nr:hypothetical protein [Rhodoblastus sphagnicola]MBB4196281.1 hypothetical protein [Rhodoblastus sphagnicola]
MSVNFRGQQCVGPASRIASDEKKIVGNAGTNNSATAVTNVIIGQQTGPISYDTRAADPVDSFNQGLQAGALAKATMGDATVKALLSCPNGKGIRCVLKGRDLHGGGECSTDDGQAFDIIVTSHK